MKIINKLSREHYTLIEKLLAQGKIISFPTETVYALSCDATNEAVINKIYQLKQRASNQVFAIFVADVEALAEYAEVDERVHKLAKKFSPGPITYVLKAKQNTELCDSLIKDAKIGIRIPDHKIAQKILQNYSKPLVATSVNLAGQPSALDVKNIPVELKDQIDLIIDGGKSKLSMESTVVDLSEPGKISILREGYISQNQILDNMRAREF